MNKNPDDGAGVTLLRIAPSLRRVLVRAVNDLARLAGELRNSARKVLEDREVLSVAATDFRRRWHFLFVELG